MVTVHLSVVVAGGGGAGGGTGVGAGDGDTGVGAVGERSHPAVGADENSTASRTTARTARFRAFVGAGIENLHMTDPPRLPHHCDAG
jgi:hypothetical protein